MTQTEALSQTARDSLLAEYRDRLEVNPVLNRSLVSYQANRKRPFYRWLKYKEGFSASLVDYALEYLGLNNGKLLDPFAGSGAALMVAREKGFDAYGVELLPVGIKSIEARLAADLVDVKQFTEQCRAFADGSWVVPVDSRYTFQHLGITQGAFPKETESLLNSFRTYLEISDLGSKVRALLVLACLNVLESISYTRKDGQYLRWDHRAPRNLPGKSFDKGPIEGFEEAMTRQLNIMQQDLITPGLFPSNKSHLGHLNVFEGSCLDILPTLPDADIDVVITSPPYCNRYDYTRTYALELAFLGIDEERLKQLRQSLLSCTVENRSKVDELSQQYAQLGKGEFLEKAFYAFERQEALQEVLKRLDHLGQHKCLNNNNIPRMVRNYFLESAIVIFELGRIVKQGGYVVMVNDNVQYGGEEVPVDLVLSDIAASAGFETERIWVLEKGKGNSSQQMGKHGRNELRKCVYVWRR